jgi:ribosome maturation factor RimP
MTMQGDPMVSAAVRSRLVQLLEPVVAATGSDLEDIQIRAAGRRSVVEVVVDRDGGVTLDDVAEIARVVSEALDADDPLGETPYTLEVGSRGVDRPLTLPRHWRRATGRLVKVSARDAATLTGRIVATDDATAELDVDGVAHHVTFADVTKAVVQVEFGKGPVPGDELDDDHPDENDEDNDDHVEEGS